MVIMKKSVALLLVFMMAISVLVGCTPTADPPSESTTSDALTSGSSGSEYTLEREEGTNQLTFYWTAEGVDYSKCDMWIWYPNADGRGYLFHECEYGAKVILNVPQDVTEVGFIVRKNCSDPGGTSWGDATKDYDGDRYAIITGETTEIYLKSGDGAQYFSTDGGKTLTQNKDFSLAAIIGKDQIQYYISPAASFTSLDQIKVLDGDREIGVTALSSLNNNVVMGTITVAEELDLSKNYTVRLEGYESKIAVPTKVFDSEDFINNYTYDGDDLGAVVNGGSTVFKLWAPTAGNVVLNLFTAGNGGEAYDKLDMVKGEKGVWSLTVPCGHKTYYTYSVTTSAGTQEAVDPYAKAVGVNGNRGMVVDLKETDPKGFSNDKFYSKINAYNEAVIWEVHVRDFSNGIKTSKYKGKYLAFTETGLKNENGVPVGMDYIKDLGITHVHFQPLYDYATVDESKTEPQFNWGYDPKNYNAPEGSYSTDPYNGEVRINEFKQMVQALHNNGMGVVMDVVYNHTYDINSNLNKVVPYYYYRYDASGAPSNGSGCGNETASDRIMFRKYMVDSVCYWAKEYHIDGFRFDLMALHDYETMQAIEAALHAINPKAIIYGEGWTGGSSALRDNLQANQANISKVTATGAAIGSVAVFNDVIRDGLKGSVFDSKDKGYINGNANAATAEKVAFGIIGGSRNSAASWSVNDNMVINYMSCHDNNTIFDKLMEANSDATDEERFMMNRLGISIIMISKGTPLFLAGDEMLRTKYGDHNSYASSDEINNLDWEALGSGSDQMRMFRFYKGLIAMRKANSFFTQADVSYEVKNDSSIVVKYTVGGSLKAIAVVNPGDQAISYALGDGSYGVLMSGEEVNLSPKGSVSGSVEIPAKGVAVYVK